MTNSQPPRCAPPAVWHGQKSGRAWQSLPAAPSRRRPAAACRTRGGGFRLPPDIGNKSARPFAGDQIAANQHFERIFQSEALFKVCAGRHRPGGAGLMPFAGKAREHAAAIVGKIEPSPGSEILWFERSINSPQGMLDRHGSRARSTKVVRATRFLGSTRVPHHWEPMRKAAGLPYQGMRVGAHRWSRVPSQKRRLIPKAMTGRGTGYRTAWFGRLLQG
jgi:hypothetical protein